jgi:hypothetical protein
MSATDCIDVIPNPQMTRSGLEGKRRPTSPTDIVDGQ